MSLKYPKEWAATHGWLSQRLKVREAIEFTKSIQNLQFGEILEIKNNEQNFPGKGPDETRLQTEKTLQSDLDSVINWLRRLEKDGQKTVSQKKVLSKIEEETGFEFKFSD